MLLFCVLYVVAWYMCVVLYCVSYVVVWFMLYVLVCHIVCVMLCNVVCTACMCLLLYVLHVCVCCVQ
jgi:hypothetical protein